jgi:anaerobic magnesium-protoporphyrin IX monomethyl ester cyclase
MLYERQEYCNQNSAYESSITCQEGIPRKVLLIVLPYLVGKVDAKASKMRSFAAFPYGLLSVATYLKMHSIRPVNIRIFDCNTYDGEDYVKTIQSILRDMRPDIVGFAMMFDNSYGYLKELSGIVKENNRQTVVVLGGAAASYSFGTIIREQKDIDGICYLEGEIPLCRLIESNDMHDFMDHNESWITRRTLGEGRQPVKSLVENLDEVIDIDYSLVDTSRYKMEEAFSPFVNGKRACKKQFFLVTSRGCPYKCVFCATSSFVGHKMRYASVNRVIEHVKHLVSNYGMNVLTIYDDQLLFNKKRAKEIFRQLAQFKIRIECPNGLSVAFIDDEMAALMRAAGLDTISLAIESGSKFVLNKIIHKPLRLSMVKPVVEILRKYGFFIQGFFVSGLPGETDEHRQETLNFIKDVELDWSGFSLATPLRGSELYRICNENGYIPKDLKIGEIEDKKYIIRMPGVDPEYVTMQTYLMNLDVNFVDNYRMRIGDYEVARNSFQDVIARYDNHAFAYYYLAKAQEAIGEQPEAVAENMKKFREIVANDKQWRSYAKYFGIEIE